MEQHNTTHEAYTRIVMAKNGIKSYKVIGKCAKIAGYSLLGYGVLTSALPSGSQLAILGGCLLLGIPYKTVIKKVKHLCGKVLFVLRIMCSFRRIKYELHCMRLSIW
jgi:hypothetical protein